MLDTKKPAKLSDVNRTKNEKRQDCLRYNGLALAVLLLLSEDSNVGPLLLEVVEVGPCREADAVEVVADHPEQFMALQIKTSTCTSSDICAKRIFSLL